MYRAALPREFILDEFRPNAQGGGALSPARAIPTPGDVIWAHEIFSIGIYSSEYFLGPKNSSCGSESQGGAWTEFHDSHG
jgi:hypothetical protein